jgi:hypothetical protein
MRSLGALKAGPGIPTTRRLAWLAVLMMIAVAVLGPGAIGASGHTDAPGANGTIKIHEDGTEPNPEVKNEPHVCTFHVHGFFFDSNSSGWYFLEQQPPTGRAIVVSQTAWHADGNGEWKSIVYALRPGHYQVHAKQTTPSTPNFQKTKTFWVECETAATPTPTPTENGGGGGATPTPTPTENGGGGGATPTPTPTQNGGGAGATPTPTPGGGVGGSTPTPTTAPGGVGGVQGATATPKVTLPPTDTVSGTAQPTNDGWRAVLIAMAALLATVLLLTPARLPARQLIRRR